MNREELTGAIHDLADSPHMYEYALEHAMGLLHLEQLAELFDHLADHHELVAGLASVLARGVDVDIDHSISRYQEAQVARAQGRRLCAHAHLDGRGAHWLGPGEVCAFAQS